VCLSCTTSTALHAKSVSKNLGDLIMVIEV
jgi:hypothetical protein